MTTRPIEKDYLELWEAKHQGTLVHAIMRVIHDVYFPERNGRVMAITAAERVMRVINKKKL